MTEDFSPRTHARRVLREEADALLALAERLDTAFDDACLRLLDTPGRIVVTGMGKSGAVGRKIVGTLASTGTPALFLHPAEALHGDLGMVTDADTVLALSYSGETDELLAILPGLKRRAAAIIAMTGNLRSTLARAADVVLDVCVPKEACPLNLAPTTSTTAMIALGDALAVAVMEARGFRKEDYALLHPAGSLGRRLLLRVSDVMRKGEQLAVVRETVRVQEALFAITKAGAGAACVVDSSGKMIGILTDGDVRRFFSRVSSDGLARPVSEAMTRSPRVTTPERLAVEALDRFEHESVKIGDLPVIDEAGAPVGMLMLKDLIRAGIVLPDAL
jgi:arabinose-5-phosphate isomerase